MKRRRSEVICQVDVGVDAFQDPSNDFQFVDACDVIGWQVDVCDVIGWQVDRVGQRLAGDEERGFTLKRSPIDVAIV